MSTTEQRARVLGRKHATLSIPPFADDDTGRLDLAAALGKAGRSDRSWSWLWAYREAWDRAANFPELVTSHERAAWSRWVPPGPDAVCWEHQAGELPIRLSFSIKVF